MWCSIKHFQNIQVTILKKKEKNNSDRGKNEIKLDKSELNSKL